MVALFALVLLGITVQRLAQLPGLFQAAAGGVLVMGAWSSSVAPIMAGKEPHGRERRARELPGRELPGQPAGPSGNPPANL